MRPSACIHTCNHCQYACMHTHTNFLLYLCVQLDVFCAQEILHKAHAYKQHIVLCQCCPSQWQSAAGQLKRSNNWALHLLTCQSCFLPVCRCCQTINLLSLFYMLPLSISPSAPPAIAINLWFTVSDPVLFTFQCCFATRLAHSVSSLCVR